MGRLKKDKATWAAVLSGIFLACIILTSVREVSLTIYFEQYPEQTMTQFFYDIGNGYSEKYTSLETASEKTQITIPDAYLESMAGFRVDLTNQEGVIRVAKMALRKNGLAVANFLPEDIAGEIDQAVQSNYCIQDGVLVINNETSDGQLYFADGFVEQIKTARALQWIELLLAVLCISIFGVLVYYREKMFLAVSNISIQKKRVLAVFVFVSGTLWCYRMYVFGERVFVFSDIGDDSLSQTYPNLYRCAALIERGMQFLGFDFVSGYGAGRTINAMNIFDWMVFFGSDNLPYLMGIGQILKVVLAFLLFYYFLRLLNRREISCLIGAASYALCGHMMMRQYWKSYSNEVVLSALLLLSLELSIVKRKHAMLAAAIFLYSITLGDYNSVLVFALVVGYTIFRYFELKNFYFREFMKTISVSIFAYIVAMIGSFAFVFPSFLKSLASERARNGISMFDIQDLFQFQNFEVIITAFLRTISETLEGKNELYYAVKNMNILEGPTFYCGLVMLLFIPLAFYKLDKKRKIMAGVVTILFIAYLSLPAFRFMANGFGGVTFKLSSFWAVILMLYYGTMGIDIWLSRKGKISYVPIVSLAVILVLLGGIGFGQNQIKIDSGQLWIFLIISVFCICIVMFRKKMDTAYVGYLLAAVTFIDLFANAHVFCNSAIAVTQNRLGQVYSDRNIDYIKEQDDSVFYRIENKNNRTHYCKGLVQDYYGLVDYSGGTNMNDYLHRFLKSMNVAGMLPETDHYMTGLSNANELYDLLCVKYVLTGEEEIDNHYGLKLIAETDDAKIYENTNMLSLGYCYTSYIEENEMEKLDILDRRSALLDSVVLEPDHASQYKNLFQEKGYTDYKMNLKGSEVAYQYHEKERKVSFDEIQENKVIILTFDMKSQENIFGTLRYGNDEQCLGSVNIGSLGTNSTQSFIFTGNKLSYFICDVGDMENIKIKIYDRDVYYQKSDAYVKDRKEHAFQCSSFSSNDIAGTVETNTDAVLSFAIPYDTGWNILVDGKKADLLRVNYGFIGAYVGPGKHDIVLQYRIPYFRITMAVSAVGVAAIIFWFIYWTKQSKKTVEDSLPVTAGQ